MIYVEAVAQLEEHDLRQSLFLAGGITNCPDWQPWSSRTSFWFLQHGMTERLITTCLTILNPRRLDFPIHDPNAALEQITWEHKALRLAAEISFWFPEETLCPIVLYELGAWSMTKKRLYVGVHPAYERRRDVEIQTELARPEIEIVYSLSELSEQIKERHEKDSH